MASSSSSGSGGVGSVSPLLRSGDQGEWGPRLSNLFSELINDVQSNDAGSLFMLPPVATEPNLGVLDLLARRASKRDACYKEAIGRA
jgi:hypothetical protein